MNYKATNILNMSKRMENHLITDKKLSCCCDSRSYCMQQYDRLKQLLRDFCFNDCDRHNTQCHRQTNGQTDGRQDYASSRSYFVAVNKVGLKHAMFTPYSPSRAYCHRTCLMIFNLTQLLFLAGRDIE